MDHQLIRQLKAEDNRAYGQLYRNCFPAVERFIISHQGNASDAADIFQEAVIVFLGKLRAGDFVLTARLKTYIFAISKNLWWKELRQRGNQVDLPGKIYDAYYELEEAVAEEKTYRDRLQKYLNKITDHCNRLVNDLFFSQRSMDDIQKDYGYTSRHSAINQKHKCLQQIRKVHRQEAS